MPSSMLTTSRLSTVALFGNAAAWPNVSASSPLVSFRSFHIGYFVLGIARQRAKSLAKSAGSLSSVGASCRCVSFFAMAVSQLDTIHLVFSFSRATARVASKSYACGLCALLTSPRLTDRCLEMGFNDGAEA
ncbi:hypothetical protein OH77DRAFT_1167323 [Trametes cingulata]|nr:hypothetical protein OH77DRAFT_1167323 [Trametes cingulata]